MLHVWNIYLHLPQIYGKCTWKFHTWSIWDPFKNSCWSKNPFVEKSEQIMLASPLCDGPGFVRAKYEFLGQKVRFFVLPKSFGESFSPKDGLDHLVWFRVGVGVTTPFPWFPRFTPLTPFFWFGWLGWILGRGFVGGWCEIQPRHCGFPWYMSGENVWKIDNWNGNFDSLTSCVPYSAGAPSNVVGFFNGTH